MPTKRKPCFPRSMSLVDRFVACVDIRSLDECWEWTASRCGSGYGQLHALGVHWFSHRLAYMLFHGEHRDVCHTCDNRGCVNPCHLFNASHSENMKDGVRKGRVVPGVWIQGRMIIAAQKRKARAQAKDERLKRMAMGLERLRDENGRFYRAGEEPSITPVRDRWGRQTSRIIPPLKRGAGGCFLPRQH